MVIKSKNAILEKKAEEIIANNESDKSRNELEEVIKQTTVYLNQSDYCRFKKSLPKGVSPSQIFGAVMCLYNSNDAKLKKLIADEIMKKLL